MGYDLGNHPELYQYTRRAKYDAAKTGTMRSTMGDAGRHALSNAAGHWQSEYAKKVEECHSNDINPSTRPVWSYPRAAYSSKRSFHETEYHRTLGNYGQNPRDKLNDNHTKIEKSLDQLSIGTTQVTKHIPGYNGFLPKSDFNSHAQTQAGLVAGRETILKQNIVENFKVKVPGYAGHLPMSSINDRGTLRPECLSMAGEKF